MQIEEGKFYKTRDGRRVGPMKHCGYDCKHPFEVTDESNDGDLVSEIWEVGGESYGEDGRSIIAEWTDDPDTLTVSRVEFNGGVGSARVFLSNGMKLAGVTWVEAETEAHVVTRAGMVVNVR